MPGKTNKPSRATPQALPCACASLRRAARAVTRLYNRALRATGLEVTQYTLLAALQHGGEATQGELGRWLALDTTTLTRMLRPLKGRGWIAARPGKDRRQRFLRLTGAGRAKLAQSRGPWEGAQQRLRRRLGEPAWSRMGELLMEVARVSTQG